MLEDVRVDFISSAICRSFPPFCFCQCFVRKLWGDSVNGLLGHKVLCSEEGRGCEGGCFSWFIPFPFFGKSQCQCSEEARNNNLKLLVEVCT